MPEKPLKEMNRRELQEYYQDRFKRQNERAKDNYDRVSASLPKGTKERIEKAGKTANGLINELVIDYLDKTEAANRQQQKSADQRSDLPEFMRY